MKNSNIYAGYRYPAQIISHVVWLYHRSHVVIQKAKVLGITLHDLPPYCYRPNLNPIERLWKVINEHAKNNCYFATAKAFKESIDNFSVLLCLQLVLIQIQELMIIPSDLTLQVEVRQV